MIVNGYTIEPVAYLIGADHYNADLRETDLRLPDLSGFDHRNVDLSGTTLKGLKL